MRPYRSREGNGRDVLQGTRVGQTAVLSSQDGGDGADNLDDLRVSLMSLFRRPLPPL